MISLKNIENFVWFPKQYLLGFLILEKQLANIPDRGFLFLRNNLELYSLSPYSQMESQTESQILGVTNDAAKPNCILPIRDDGSSYDDHSSGELIVININETQLSWKQQSSQ